MEKICVISGADRGLGFGLCQELLEKGWKVFAGQYIANWKELSELKEKHEEKLFIIPMDVSFVESVQKAFRMVKEQVDHVDMIISNAGIFSGKGDLRGEIDYKGAEAAYNINAIGPIRLVESFLPLMKSGLKRLCFVSSEVGSISMAYRDRDFGYSISKTGLNMAIKIMFNDLHPHGYTFRSYHPGWVRTYMSGSKNNNGDLEPIESAIPAIKLFTEDREDEERLVMIDYLSGEWPY
ncbi:MAG TPA: SDR family NAD(P)-dependent oxidoreductase [Clostridiaceae bacterium]